MPDGSDSPEKGINMTPELPERASGGETTPPGPKKLETSAEKALRRGEPVSKRSNTTTNAAEEAHERLRELREETEREKAGVQAARKRKRGPAEEAKNARDGEKGGRFGEERQRTERRGIWGRAEDLITRAGRWAETHGKELIIGFQLVDEVLENFREFRNGVRERMDRGRAEREARRDRREREGLPPDRQPSPPSHPYVEPEPERPAPVQPPPPSPEPKPAEPVRPSEAEIWSERAKSMKVEELQRSIMRAELGSEKLNALRAEKERRLDELSEEHQARIGETLEARTRDELIQILNVSFPTNFRAPLEEYRRFPVEELLDDDRHRGLRKIMREDEVRNVLLGIYKNVKDPVIRETHVPQEDTLKQMEENDKKSRINMGASINNPVGILNRIPATLDEWNEQAAAWPFSPEVRQSMVAYYSEKEDSERRAREEAERAVELASRRRTEGVQKVEIQVSEEDARKAQEDFIALERWSDTTKFESIEKDDYYRSLDSDDERTRYRRRLMLHHAVFYKKRNAWTFEAMAKNAEMQELAIEDIQALYETPGVSKVLQEYVRLMDTNERIGMGYTDPITRTEDERALRECTTRDMIDVFRKRVQNKIEEEMYRTLPTENESEADYRKRVQETARTAEQIGFNLAVTTNLFESLDAQWEGINKKTGRLEPITGDYRRVNYSDLRRVRGFKIFQGATDILNKPIRTAFNPIDALIEMATKEERKETETGVFTSWASNQIRNSLRGAGFSGDFKDFEGFEEVELIDDEDSNNYWKVENDEGHYKLFIPELYPLRQIGSYWEDAKAYDLSDMDRISGQPREKSFLEFMREGKEIPFDMAYRAPGFSGYLVDANYWVGVWNLFDNEVAKKGGVDEEVMLKALGNVGERDNEGMIRWLGYAYRGIDENKRLPTMQVTIGDRETYEIISREAERVGEVDNLYNKENMFFGWDREPTAKDRFKRWWRRIFW
ncbi:hypothetical protein A3A76_02200 [Candidatus Woesebacteria bacterium RIFCSPLOWO2_01_FULL_39_23]|uniref:Uncharacterized protein n=1 Tax=Candidatus Woesebacteria bacterium RIFCSPHIGHO2_01_FULL_40_22 TaxID=1802499 RepID=A0A1F7YG22_9BACT|nr:MAG: hypothetical protein A2628_02635 [Candidatus Woesebacteria bacterium RIFCSPHIGHO2_01_FULL_40_22]OGM36219.1 MAG: hypothetical protein A3E41_02000 [Candidatus Woesebacteria bacterium RIFCSPHIGHO2_12_FULL_38_9]OGM62370.1 MAG: hypothetical protein A3A76_02200 [Candidatus Woesebacteria bacterium RIFCSPLOWO2_01_FULL_39_23]